MKTEVLSLIENHGPLTTSKVQRMLATVFEIESDSRELFDLLNNEARKQNLVRSSGSVLGGQGNYQDILCFYWSMSE